MSFFHSFILEFGRSLAFLHLYFVTYRQKVSRRYTYPLQAGHGIAVMCTETTKYRYLEQLEAPKKWFQSNVNSVISNYGMQHNIQKEDLFLGVYLPISIVLTGLIFTVVIGTLCAPNHALFVSHSHPDGHVRCYFFPLHPSLIPILP